MDTPEMAWCPIHRLTRVHVEAWGHLNLIRNKLHQKPTQEKEKKKIENMQTEFMESHDNVICTNDMGK